VHLTAKMSAWWTIIYSKYYVLFHSNTVDVILRTGRAVPATVYLVIPTLHLSPANPTRQAGGPMPGPWEDPQAVPSSLYGCGRRKDFPLTTNYEDRR